MNTFLSALSASAVLFLSNMVTLFTNDPALTFDAITQAAWVSIAGGAAIAFLKDYQAITSRRFINRITKTGDGGI